MKINSERAMEIIYKLMERHPDAHCELVHSNPFELLVATILSAQATDVKVNEITTQLFVDFPGPQAFAQADLATIEEGIRGLGLFRNKSKAIKATSEILLDQYKGQVPNDRAALEALPGVGRKTANVVLSNAFGHPAIAVDTHVQRVSNRIGLAQAKEVLETEKQLMKLIPKDWWTQAHHLLIFHGRRICSARKPLCDQCPISDQCNYFESNSRSSAVT